MDIQTETKESGSWSQYIEVGIESIDAFGDTVFLRKGYAKSYPGIGVQRKYEGSGSACYCRWLLTVPDDFRLTIRKVTNPGGSDRRKKYETLYAPQSV